jgi:hypothetical protein
MAFQNGEGDPTTRRQMRFYYCAFAYLAAYCLYYYVNTLLNPGDTEKYLREQLVARFLYLSEAGVKRLGNSAFFDTAILQVNELNFFGWVQSQSMFQSIIAITANMIFQVYLLMRAVEGDFLLAFVLAIPTFLVFVMIVAFRANAQEQAMMVESRANLEIEWMGLVEEMVDSRQLISQLHVTEPVLSIFRNTYTRFFNESKKADTLEMNTHFIPKWFFAIGLVCVYANVPLLIRWFSFSPGDLAALVMSWVALGHSFNSVFIGALKMARAHVALLKVAECLNAPDRISEHLEYEELVEKDNTLSLPSVPQVLEDLDVIRFEKVHTLS